MDPAQKYSSMYGRFLKFAAEAQERYAELRAILEPLTKVSNLQVFLLFFKNAEESQDLLEICKNADEEYQTTEVDRVVGLMLQTHQLDADRFDFKDRAKLVKYLRVFSDLALNGIE
jgi:homospermidine synthase